MTYKENSTNNNESNEKVRYDSSNSYIYIKRAGVILVIAICLLCVILRNVYEPFEVVRVDHKMCETSSFFDDQINYISNKSELKEGLKDFYIKTGVIPHLIIMNSTNIPNYNDYKLNLYVDNKNKELFNNKDHVLFGYVVDTGDVNVGYGYNIKNVSYFKLEYQFKKYLKDYSSKDVSKEKALCKVLDSIADGIVSDKDELFKSYNIAICIFFIMVILIIYNIKKSLKCYMEVDSTSDLTNIEDMLDNSEKYKRDITIDKATTKSETNDILHKSKNKVYDTIVEKPLEELKNSEIEELKKQYDNLDRVNKKKKSKNK